MFALLAGLAVNYKYQIDVTVSHMSQTQKKHWLVGFINDKGASTVVLSAWHAFKSRAKRSLDKLLNWKGRNVGA